MYEVERLKQEFAQAYPEAGASRVCNAPGRVNLIGEHTDYNGLPVLPMTIRQDIRIVFAPRHDNRIHLRNVDAMFPECEFLNCPDIPHSAPGAWDNYCKAAVQGLNQHVNVTQFPGMDVLVAGCIPLAAGLSSSSALVVASALAYLAVLGKEIGRDIPRIALATLLAEAEHYVGTKGGGMDQAIILLGKPGYALKIDFFPLRVEEAPLIEGHDIIVANSLVRARKTGDMLHRYNDGPRTCKLICALMEKQAREEFGVDVEFERLGDLWNGHLCLTNDEVRGLATRAIPNAMMTLNEAANALGMAAQSVRDRWLGDLKEPEKGFSLRARMRHQITEFERVEAARDALLAADAETLGDLMNASHESCARDYQVSCRELDCLVAVARESGAMGARLTGAGMGGCTVNLAPSELRREFFEKVEQGYYREYLAQHPDAQPSSHMFVAEAGPGAGYLD